MGSVVDMVIDFFVVIWSMLVVEWVGKFLFVLLYGFGDYEGLFF